MKIYLVGGAVRDQLLGREIKDKDYVVVGASPQTMLDLGYKTVGQDFPVFLHPKTHDEYALARTERKTAKGYHGFDFNADEFVTLEQDLSRRDLTINAMAKDIKTGEIIDPYGGQKDLEKKVLRHVSEAFAEDPVRILRIARFAARYSHLGFKVSISTNELMKKMVKNHEVDALVPERVFQELSKSLNETTPSAFIKTLKSCNALAILFPEFHQLFGVPQTEKWHPEIDTGIHCMMAMDQASNLDNETAFAVFNHDLGKGITPQDILPSHKGHEQAGVALVENVCDRLKVPKHHKDLALVVCRWHLHSHMAFDLRAGTIHKLFKNTRAYQNPEKFFQFLKACKADATGRLGKENNDYPQAIYLQKCLQSASNVDIKALMEKGFAGQNLGAEIEQQRIKIIKRVKLSYLFL